MIAAIPKNRVPLAVTSGQRLISVGTLYILDNNVLGGPGVSKNG